MFAPQRGEHFPGSVSSAWVEAGFCVAGRDVAGRDVAGRDVASRDGPGKKMRTQNQELRQFSSPSRVEPCFFEAQFLFRSSVSAGFSILISATENLNR